MRSFKEIMFITIKKYFYIKDQVMIGPSLKDSGYVMPLGSMQRPL